MSFILDALKKSETDRQRQNGPALFEVKVAPPRTGLPLWAVGLGVLLAVNLIIVAWVLLRRPAQADANAAQGQTFQAAADRRGGQGPSQEGSGASQGGQSWGGAWQGGQPGQGQGSGQAWQGTQPGQGGGQNAQSWQGGGGQPGGQNAPNWQGGGQPGQQGQGQSWQAGAPGQGGQGWQGAAPGQGGWQGGGQPGQGGQPWGGQQPGQSGGYPSQPGGMGPPGGPGSAPQGQQGQTMVPAGGTANAAPAGAPGDTVNADDYAPAADPPAAAPLGSRVARGTSSGVPLYQDAAIQTKLPELRLDLHVFAALPQNRFVMINMHKLREGDSLPEGVRVESITPEGAVLSKDGTRFLLPRQ